MLERLIVGWLRRLSAVFKNTLEIITGVGVAKAMQCIERQNKTLLYSPNPEIINMGRLGPLARFRAKFTHNKFAKIVALLFLHYLEHPTRQQLR